jgi:hypothetical protein
MQKHLILAFALLSTQPLWPQASEIPSAAPAQVAGQTPEQRGRKLLDEMLEALGGNAWLNRRNLQERGHLARFFRGAPTGIVIDFTATHQFPTASRMEAQRIGFITDKSIIFPGKKIDIVQIWTAGKGYEVTYKGEAELPKDQVADFYRRQDHSIESIYRTWLKAPDVMVVAEGTTMVERRLADKVTILSANNDAVTVDDAEEYADYHTIQGLPTALTITRYHNGDMASQTFLLKVEYDVDIPADNFNPEVLLKKKQ